MSETTQIHPDKVRAYLATDYRLGHTSQDIVLNIGKRSERLAALVSRQIQRAVSVLRDTVSFMSAEVRHGCTIARGIR
jgi:hypothetical protein